MKPKVGSQGVKFIGPLLETKQQRQREYALKRDSYLVQSVHPADVASFEADGWEVQREGSRKVKIRKQKPHDCLLEDQAWCMFYRMGYQDLSGTNCKIEFDRSNSTRGAKQVDVFAKDEETVIIAECKSRETRGRRPLQKDIHETTLLQKPFANSIRSHYGRSFKPKIIWMYITHNIIWSDADLQRAAAANIRVLTENEMQYFDAFVKHLGPAARFQFLAEFLEGQTIPGLEGVRTPATRGTLGKHKFYSFVTTPRHLLKIAFVNHLALNHPEGRPAYQRMISSARIKEIGGFLKRGGFFPTNLLVNFTEQCRFDLLPNKENADDQIKFGYLYLPSKYKSAWVIDGQHRLYGYSGLDDKLLDQTIAVIAFEQMDTKDEADLFVTINHKQKSVPKSVIVALQADLKWDSTDPKERLSALSSRLAKTLNSDPTSPLFQRFSAQGVPAKESQSLTLPELVQGLNKSGLIGKNITKGLLAPGALSGSTDDQTNDRARRFLNGYFSAVRDANSGRWDAAKTGYISTNPGVRAHLLLISDVMKYLQAKEDLEPQLLSEDELLKQTLGIVEPILKFLLSARDEEIYEKFSRKFGEGGVRDYADNLAEIVLRKRGDFGSEEFKQRLAKRNDERVARTNQQVIDLSKDITDYVFMVLKRHHGTDEQRSGEKAYWVHGVENQKIKQDAYTKMLQDKSRHPIENYVELIALKDIVTQQNNWGLFKNVMSIPLSGEAKGRAHYLGWLQKFNEIRRIPAHPTSVRGYEEADYELIRFIQYEFHHRKSLALGVQSEDAA